MTLCFTQTSNDLIEQKWVPKITTSQLALCWSISALALATISSKTPGSVYIPNRNFNSIQVRLHRGRWSDDEVVIRQALVSIFTNKFKWQRIHPVENHTRIIRWRLTFIIWTFIHYVTFVKINTFPFRKIAIVEFPWPPPPSLSIGRFVFVRTIPV